MGTGMYVDDFVDLQIPTAGTYPLVVSRRYDSSRPADGPMGAGWSSSLTAHLYYATYLFAAPSTYSYDVDVVMPDGVFYQFRPNGSSFVPPYGRHDTLVRNTDGTYTLTPQFTRSVYAFNADGSLASFTDEFGNVITYTNDASGRLQRMADSSGSGRYVDVTWGPDGRLASVTDNAGRALKYFYENNDGTLTSYSDASVSADNTTRSAFYSYVPSRFGKVLSRVEDRWHRVVTEVTWYASGEVKTYTEGAYDGANSLPGEKYTYTYFRGTSGGSVTKSDSLGSRTFSYNTAGLVNNYATYDVLGQLTSETTPFGTRSYNYGADGNVTSMTDASGTWTYTYDANFPNKVTSVTSNSPGIWAGAKFEYNPPGTPASGALAKVFRVRNDGTTKDQVAAYEYDNRGHVTSFTDENGLVTSYAYNASGDLTSTTRSVYTPLTTSFGYDTLGRQTTVTSPAGQTINYSYDDLDRVLSVTLPKPTAGSPLNFSTTYSYDNYDATSGLVFTNVTDPNSRMTRTGRDALGHVLQAMDALGNLTSYTYQFNLLKKITDANGNETSYTYSPTRDLATTTFPDGTTETYSITRGVLYSKTDRRGHTVTYSYDALGRILSDGVASYTYNGQNLTAAGDVQFTYDPSWRLATETIIGGEKTTYTYLQAYYPATAPSLLYSYKIEPPTGANWSPQTVTYAYDYIGRVASIYWSWLPNQLFSIAYAPNGQYSQVTFPNGQTRTFTYDNQARLTSVANKDPQGNVLASFDYSYDYDWTNATYTMLGQRTSVMVTSAFSGTNLDLGVSKYRYDANYQLTRVDHPDGSYETWTYDPIGNRATARTRSGYSLSYTYYKNGTNANNGQRLKSDGYSPWPYDFTYDANGNMTRNSQGVTATWDDVNRLATYAGSTTSYDYLSRRRTVTAGGSTTRYISFGQHTVGQRNTTAGITTDYLFGPGIDIPLAKRTANGAISYYGADGLGSVVLVTDAAGTITASASYSPWGEPSQFTELFGYAGRETTSGGPWFYRARNYDATRGRFLSEDPIGENLNGYVYVFNNPVRLKDPTGLKVFRCCAKADIPLNPGFSHCWLKTSTREAGLGNVDVGQPAGAAIPNNQCGPHDGPFVQTQIINHLGEAASRANTKCEEVPDVDEKCVDDEIWTDNRGYGKTQGLWTPWHQCNSVADAILDKCRKRRCVSHPPSPPSDNGKRYF
jgi:RHS repeat-associated protein